MNYLVIIDLPIKFLFIRESDIFILSPIYHSTIDLNEMVIYLFSKNQKN